jgi:hypothetical protein
VAAEAADGECGAIEGEGGDDGVDAGAVEEAGVDDGLGLIDAAANLGDDLLDDVEEVAVVFEADGAEGEFAVAFDVDLVIAVDEDIGDGGFLEERLERTEAEDFIEDLFDHLVGFGGGHGNAFVFEEAFDDAADFGADAILGQGGDFFEVEDADELFMDFGLELEIAVGGAYGSG